MPKQSAGILLYRKKNGQIEFMLVHPGGPIYGHRDNGYWDIPKGEIRDGEDPFGAAQREFQEETGFPLPSGPYHELGTITQKSGKIVHAWAAEGDANPAALASNTFAIEWPPHAGRIQEFPEVDRADFFTFASAREKIMPSQYELLERTMKILAG